LAVIYVTNLIEVAYRLTKFQVVRPKSLEPISNITSKSEGKVVQCMMSGVLNVKQLFIRNIYKSYSTSYLHKEAQETHTIRLYSRLPAEALEKIHHSYIVIKLEAKKYEHMIDREECLLSRLRPYYAKAVATVRRPKCLISSHVLEFSSA
jgi:hypothetical protein